MKFKTLKDTGYWYGVYQGTVRPLLLEMVESNDHEDVKWDNSLLDAFDYIVNKLFGPEEKAE